MSNRKVHFYYLATFLSGKFNIKKLTGTKQTGLLNRLDPFLHQGIVSADKNAEINMQFCQWLGSPERQNLKGKDLKASGDTRDKQENLFRNKQVYGGPLYNKYHKQYHQNYLMSVIQERLSNEEATTNKGGRLRWKPSARDAYLMASGLTPFKPAAWLKAKDIVPEEHRKIQTAVDGSVYKNVKEVLNLHQQPEIVIDRGDKQAMKALKKAMSGKCGVYRWVHKESFKTYVGGAKSQGDRPFRHAGVNSTNKALKQQKNREGNGSFYLAILWIAGISERVNSQNVYNVEMDYFQRTVPEHQLLNRDTVVNGEYKGKPLDRERKRRISRSLKGKGRSDEVKAAISAGNPSGNGIQQTRYLTDREMCSPGGVKGDVQEVKNYPSQQSRRLRNGYKQHTSPIARRCYKYPPLFQNKNTGYWYLVTKLTPAQKSILKMEPWPKKPSKK